MREFCLSVLIYAIVGDIANPFYIGNKAVEYYEKGFITENDLLEIQKQLFPTGDVGGLSDEQD